MYDLVKQSDSNRKFNNEKGNVVLLCINNSFRNWSSVSWKWSWRWRLLVDYEAQETCNLEKSKCSQECISWGHSSKDGHVLMLWNKVLGYPKCFSTMGPCKSKQKQNKWTNKKVCKALTFQFLVLNSLYELHTCMIVSQ